jgi:hypothetical protein
MVTGHRIVAVAFAGPEQQKKDLLLTVTGGRGFHELISLIFP